MTGRLAAFVGVSLVVIVTPGPDTVLTIRNALLGGRRAGTCTALGVVTGQALWTLATSAGLVRRHALAAGTRPDPEGGSTSWCLLPVAPPPSVN
jgi:threonine/homoserine/homoserine lactone efflux protein